jgi:DNA-binding LacI/PurR family transcriptional regulator
MPTITKSQQVERRLRNSIAKKVLPPGSLLPTEAELVEKFNVSRTTVRDALNALANDGLLERRQGAGTFVAKDNKKSCIAILANLDQYTASVGHYYRTMVEELKKCIAEAGFQAVFTVGHGQSEEEFASSFHLLERQVAKQTAGLISLSALDQLEERLEEAGIVNVSVVAAAPTGKHNIVHDYSALTNLACDHLRECGYEDFAIMELAPFAGEGHAFWYGECHRLVRMAVRSPEHIIEVERSWDYAGAYEAFKKWWAKPNRPRAIFFYDDALCEVATRAVLELGIKVPEELGIITLANVGRKFQFPVQLTTIGSDLSEVARTAWDYLQQLMGGQEVNPNVYIQPKLFAGDSLILKK